MAYGKKRGRSSSARRKSNRKKRVQRGLSRAEKKEVHRIIAGETELKKTDSEYTTNCYLAAPTVLDFFQPVIQGVQADERIGDQITIKKCMLKFRFFITLNSLSIMPTSRDIDECPRDFRWFVVSKKNNVQNPTPSTISASPADFNQFFKVGQQTEEYTMGMPDMHRDVNTDIYTVHDTGRFTLGMKDMQYMDVQTLETSGSIGKQFIYSTGDPSPVGTQVPSTNTWEDAELSTTMQSALPRYRSAFDRRFACQKTLSVSVPKAGLGKLNFVQQPGEFADKDSYIPKKRYFFVLFSGRFDGSPNLVDAEVGVQAYTRHIVHYTDS